MSGIVNKANCPRLVRSWIRQGNPWLLLSHNNTILNCILNTYRGSLTPHQIILILQQMETITEIQSWSSAENKTLGRTLPTDTSTASSLYFRVREVEIFKEPEDHDACCETESSIYSRGSHTHDISTIWLSNPTSTVTTQCQLTSQCGWGKISQGHTPSRRGTGRL